MQAQYEAPKLIPLGSVAAFTRGGSDGQSLDAAFPAGTDRGSLTFS